MQKVIRNTKSALAALLLVGLVFYSVFGLNNTETMATANAETIGSYQGKQKVVLAAGTKYATDLYIISSGKPGPVAMVVGGMYGDGIAGIKAASEMTGYLPENGTLLVLPEANKLAVQLNQKIVPGEDNLNRIFPRSAQEEPKNVLAKAIYDAVKQYNVTWLIDMHESNDFSKLKTGNTGQSLIHNPDTNASVVANKIVNTLNQDISKTEEQFSLLKYPAKGSLVRSSSDYLGVNSFILETCSKQKLLQRINYQVKAASLLLQEIGMITIPAETKVKVVLAAGTKYATDLYIIKSGKPGPVVMIVGGVHGSEIAGAQAAAKVKDFTIKSGTLIVLPEANKRAVDIKKRLVSGEGDLNRAFPTTAKGTPSNTLSKAIYDAVKKHKVEWLIDMHEGFDYYTNSATDSVGQTLIQYPAGDMPKMAAKIVKGLNEINSSKARYTLIKYPVKGSLARSTGQYLGVNSCILESSMKQSLSVRVNNHLKAAGILLKELNMQ
ncbi:MAG: succinylglutamate desuccinylase/aspartoacylase family protein [Syntrophomonadaceae bacterium]|nr:succinylglutamate desuccinylase/aspartoacylase family protein [Syntrophomonadaceae bacterium]